MLLEGQEDTHTHRERDGPEEEGDDGDVNMQEQSSNYIDRYFFPSHLKLNAGS